MAKLLGIDYGEKRIGLALSDEGGRYAFNYSTLENKGDMVTQALQSICQREGVETIILGLPLNQEGGIGVAAERVKRFALKLKQRLGRRVIFEDERFSTALAASLLRQGGKSVREARGVIDQSSAQIILQAYLDRHHG